MGIGYTSQLTFVSMGNSPGVLQVKQASQHRIRTLLVQISGPGLEVGVSKFPHTCLPGWMDFTGSQAHRLTGPLAHQPTSPPTVGLDSVRPLL